MGKTRTSVGTSVSRAIEDALIPNSIRKAIENSVIQNTEVSEYMVAGLADGLASRCHRMYDFAARGLYAHGRPSGNFYTPAETGEDEVLTVLRGIEGAGVDVMLEYLHYGAPNNLHFGWVRLVEDHGYDTDTNQLGELTAAKGAPVYLEDMVSVVPLADADKIDTATLAQWGISPRAGSTPERLASTGAARKLLKHSPVEYSAAATQEHLRVTYVWMAAGGLQRESLTIPVTGLSETVKFFHAAYTADGVRKFFFYEDGDGAYAALDAVFDAPPSPNGSFFPFIYFRFDKKSELENTESASYKTGKQLMGHLGMDYDSVAEAINANPDIADVEQAMLMMAVPANTTNKIECRYLWDFFNDMNESRPPPERFQFQDEGLLGSIIDAVGGFDGPGVAIQDGRFKMWLDNEGIYKRRVAGKIGRIGTYSGGYQSSPAAIDAIDPVTGETTRFTTPGGYHFYRRQVSSAFYDEIQVVGLRTLFQIYGGHMSIGDEEDPILLVPLDKAITGRYPMTKREELYARSLHYVFNSRVTQKVKWYQTSFFRAVLIIVMIVVTVLTQGATAKELAALIAAGSYAAAAYIVLVKILETLLIRAIFKVLVRALGTKAAFVVAVLAAVAGVVDAIDSGSLAGAPFAKDLLMLSSGLTAALDTEFQDQLLNLSKEFEDFDYWKKEQEEVLKAGRDLLGDVTHLNPFVIFGESPQDYYNRTVHSGNIGVLSIEAVSGFVETKLQLPKLQDSLGGMTT